MEYTFYKLSIADKCYIGSTTHFNNRMKDHKSVCSNENSRDYNYKVYQYIRENGCWNDVEITIIDKIICLKREAEDIETKFMLRDGAELNSVYPKRSKKEYIEQHKEKYVEYHKQLYKDNKQQILERCKEYREKNKEKIKEKNKIKITCDICSKMLSRSHIARHKKIIHSFIDGNTHPF
tara:strand:- start:202 stop:738 length:537 start_codon:yes stop_codon:yes gene_type:complete